jgi:predicted Zn-dependent protease
MRAFEPAELGRLVERADNADEMELSAVVAQGAAVRFAGSTIIQAAVLQDPLVQARVLLGRRLGVARDVDPTHALVKAGSLAAHAPEQSDLVGFAAPAPFPDYSTAFDAATAALEPADQVARIEPLFARAARSGLELAGCFRAGTTALAVATSRGVRALHRLSWVRVELIASDGEASGYAAGFGRAAAGLDLPALAETACAEALAMKAPLELGPGAWDVVLEPPAVAECLEWMAMTAFGAREVETGLSFLSGREGQALTGEGVHLADDASAGAAGAPPVPFDAEGVPCARVVLIDGGRGGRPCHDLRSAARAGVRSTGHAPPLGEDLVFEGPIALHVELAAGQDSRQALYDRVERGLAVTRFHYVNGLGDPRRALQTGMTRDGLRLIEQGRLGRGVRPLRFTESMLEALGRLGGATRDRQAVPVGSRGLGAFVAPSVLLRGFHFTGTR